MTRRQYKRITLLVTIMWGVFVLAGLMCAIAQAAELPRDAYRYRSELVRNARLVWGLDAPTATFAAQIHQESLWRADARSRVGALGMAQFMPATADWIVGAYPALNTRESDATSPGGNRAAGAGPAPLNPSWAIRALLTYDRHLWERLSGVTPCERMAMTLSAYNGGLGWVRRDRRMAAAGGDDPERWFGSVERHNAGRASWAYTENRGYPRRILLQHEPRYAAAGFGPGICP